MLLYLTDLVDCNRHEIIFLSYKNRIGLLDAIWLVRYISIIIPTGKLKFSKIMRVSSILCLFYCFASHIRHNVLNHQQIDCLFKNWFRLTILTIRKTVIHHISDLLWWESNGGFPQSLHKRPVMQITSACHDIIMHFDGTHTIMLSLIWLNALSGFDGKRSFTCVIFCCQMYTIKD